MQIVILLIVLSLPAAILIDSKKRLGKPRWGWAIIAGFIFMSALGQIARDMQATGDSGSFGVASLVGGFAGAWAGFFTLYRILTRKAVVRKEFEVLSKKCPSCAEEIKLEAKVCHYCNHKFDETEIAKIEKYVQAHNLLKEKQPKINKMKLLFKLYRIVGGLFFVFGGLFVILVLAAIFKVPETHAVSLIVFGIFSSSLIFLGIFMFRKMKKVKMDYMKIKEEIEELPHNSL